MIEFTPYPQGFSHIREAAFQATVDTFKLVEQEAKSEAHFGRYDRGKTRESIDFEVKVSPEGPRAEIFTQSGHGVYLEVGTRKMHAEPFLWPAFRLTISKFFDIAKGKLG